ncbi:MAG: DUF4845 domain-containing protein [Burkholderiales bacterium]|nr:DUF4845 domain-containing protein [Burkholderiales bacterium]
MWHRKKLIPLQRQAGLSIVGLILILIALSAVAMLLMKVIPVVVEYRSMRAAIYTARDAGTTAREIKDSFTKQKISGYFTSLGADDLEITQEAGHLEVSFAYQKKIPIVGPVSLLFDFEATTAKTNPFADGPKKPAASVP